MKRFALCLGATHLDPAGHEGWDGVCPGCDVDVERLARLCLDRGFDGVFNFFDAAVDHPFVRAVFLSICNRLAAGDLLVLFFSGHGGQQRDRNGDEDDGLDETMCWWSGELLDDTIAEYLRMIPEGVRVLFISDSCNSGTSHRGRPARDSRPIVLTQSSQALQASMIHFGGCSDGRYSYGDQNGGEFTTQLIRVARRARRPISYREWFRRAAGRMPKYQTPSMALWGQEDFSDMEILT